MVAIHVSRIGRMGAASSMMLKNGIISSKLNIHEHNISDKSTFKKYYRGTKKRYRSPYLHNVTISAHTVMKV